MTVVKPDRNAHEAERDPNAVGDEGNAGHGQSPTYESAHSCFLLSDERGECFGSRPSIPVRTKNVNGIQKTHNSPSVPRRRAA